MTKIREKGDACVKDDYCRPAQQWREREREIDLSRTACILVVGKPVQEFAMATTERGMSDILLIV